MDFFTNAIDVLQTLVIALGGGLCVWGGTTLPVKARASSSSWPAAVSPSSA